MKRVIVIGAGAAGLFAAYTAAKGGNSVLVCEKNEKAGKKIYITGKGRCNLTNDRSPEDFLQNVVHGGKFLLGAIHRFSPSDTMAFLEEEGLALKVERGGRVFPVSDHASDVTKTLVSACKKVGVEFRFQTEVKGIEVKEGVVCGVTLRDGRLDCDCVIVATGGLSYPATGSTGDGYRFAAEFGHVLVPCSPSLTGIEIRENCTSMQGISLKNVALTARRGKKSLFFERGEMLFTHYGISGPLVLTLSALITRLPMKEISLSIDLKPALDAQKLDARLVRDLEARSREEMKSVLRASLPAGVVGAVLARAAIPPERRANSLTREERGRLVTAMKQFTLTPVALRGFEEAVVTSGGVDCKEVDPKTMESKRVKGLYFCGEVLDVDAFTGGFNLQIAFSTGFAAGSSIK